ncbi:MAG TPA: glutathione S-transferase family protein [Allosphingosinicella sp.]|jgi:glutathione S-transferase
MTLRLFYHPFSSFCQKVLIALYERDVPFEPVLLNPGDPEQRATLAALWPMAKFPVLRDEARGVTVPESTLIIEYLDRVHEGPPPLVPTAPDAALEVGILDRCFDQYVMAPMQRAVADHFRPDEARDAWGVEEAKRQLSSAYDILDARLAANGGPWAAGATFTLADCAAAPALFYAAMIEPFDGRPALYAYYRRVRARPSFARTVDEARPFRAYFPPGWREAWD